MAPLFTLLLIILITSIYYLCWKNRNYWIEKGITGPKPHFFFGNMKETITGRLTLGQQFAKLYEETKRHPYAGIFMLQRATLIINDLDMVRNILNKDFEHFTDRPISFNVKNDPVTDHLLTANGSRWKNMRNKMTPTFTSSKMRDMFGTLEDCCKEMISFLDVSEGDRVEDMKELLAKLTTNIIGSCAFGIECNSFQDPNSKFRRMGKRSTNLPRWRNLLFLSNIFAPKLAYNLGISVLGKDLNDFFYDLVKDGIGYRRKNNIVRKDFLQILMDMLLDEDEVLDDQTKEGSKLTLRQLSAQAFVFFLAGFETSSSAASFALYELAMNPEVQKRLLEEIKDYLNRNDGKITYDSLREMTYLTQVVKETMRKYPAVPALFRICTKQYQIPNTDIIIEKDTPVLIPIFGIHKDEDIHPDPEKFDPERFSDENKDIMHPYAFLPFGEGPRSCIGNRFGLMQTKLAIVTIISNYEVVPCEKTPVPIIFNPKSLPLQSKDGIVLKLTKRKK